MLDTARRIATPEGIELSLPLAGPVPRALAWLLDLLLRLGIMMGVAMVLGLGLRRRWEFGRILATAATGAVAALVVWGVMLWQVWGVSLSALRAELTLDAVATQREQAEELATFLAQRVQDSEAKSVAGGEPTEPVE